MNKYLVEVKLEQNKEMVKNIVEENHYSHAMPQAIKYRFSLYYEKELKGVAVFSVPANRFAITSIFEDETQHVGIELSRFFTYDDTPNNFESYCLTKCFDYIKHNTEFDVIISYADPNFGHAGYLYQALNGLYIGKTAPEVRYMYQGKLLTRRSLGRRKGESEAEHAKRIIEDGAKKIKMEGKYKYLFFTCNKKRKANLLHKLKGNIEIHKKYPKIDKNNKIKLP